jgi:CRISPR-associated protein Csx14
MEAALVLMPEAEITAAFDWSVRPARFRLRAEGTEADPVREVLGFLKGAELWSEAPSKLNLNTNKWVPTREPDPCDVFPFRKPESLATLPVVLAYRGRRIVISFWGDDGSRDNAKFWGGAGGYPGAALARDALALLPEDLTAHASDPFNFATTQSSSFRLDWRRDYVPIDAGFSVNFHKKENDEILMIGFPLVELMAAIGLENARPLVSAESKLCYSYGVLGCPRGACLPPALLRAALGAMAPPVPGLPFRRFRMNLSRPSKMERSIIDVIEETPA